MKYCIHYFTGTGNTERAVTIVAALLRERGHEVSIVDIARVMAKSAAQGSAPGTGTPPDAAPKPERSAAQGSATMPAQSASSGTSTDSARSATAGATTDSARSAIPDEHIFAFPTYAWMPPDLVVHYFHSLPLSQGWRAYVLAVDGGGSFAAPSAAARMLKHRGFEVSLALSASYTENWTQFVEPPDTTMQKRLNDAGDTMARNFAEKILAGKREIQRAGLLGGFLLIAGFMFRKLGRRILGLAYIADSDCTSCALCARTCPAAVISMKGKPGETRPEWNSRCENCQRCINSCPARAINTSTARIVALAVNVILLSLAYCECWLMLIHPLLPRNTLGLLINTVGIGMSIVLGHWIGLISSASLLSILQRTALLRKVFEASRTKNYRRYLAPGYKPTAAQEND